MEVLAIRLLSNNKEMKVDTSYIQFFSTEAEGEGKPVNLETIQKDSNGRLIKGRVIHDVHCNLEFVENKQVQIEYWNSEKKGILVVNSLDEIRINGETLEPYSSKQQIKNIKGKAL